jgi:hypothetical protein
MVALVRLTETKTGLRIDTNDDDTLIGDLIDAASEQVVTYLKDEAEVLIDLSALADSPSDYVAPAYIRRATILQVDYLYRGDFAAFDALQPLCPAAMALLYSKRVPTLA